MRAQIALGLSILVLSILGLTFGPEQSQAQSTETLAIEASGVDTLTGSPGEAKVIDKLSAEFSSFLGDDANAVVTGLRNGTPINLTTTDPDSTPTDTGSTTTDPSIVTTDSNSTTTDTGSTTTDPSIVTTDSNSTTTDTGSTTTDPSIVTTDSNSTTTDTGDTTTDPSIITTDPNLSPIGTTLTLTGTDTTEGGTSETITINPPTGKMGFGNVRISLALAQQLLDQVGIDQPTPEQLQAALLGGNITTGTETNPAQLQGILTLRSQGKGWGQIAYELGYRLGHVISGRQSIVETTRSVNPGYQPALPADGVADTGGQSVVPTANGVVTGSFGARGRGAIVTGSVPSVGSSRGITTGRGQGYGRGIVTGAGRLVGPPSGVTKGLGLGSGISRGGGVGRGRGR